jgi:hypothetical protein
MWYDNLNMKRVLLLLLLLILITIFSFKTVEAYLPLPAEVFLHIDDTSIVAGQAISGKATIRLYEDPGGGNFFINFGDGTPNLLFQCDFNPDAPEGYTICEKQFVHVYQNPNTYTLTLTTPFYDPFISAVVTRTARITVSEEPTSPPATFALSPITATTIEEVIRRTTSIIYWIGASIAIIMILLGGFYLLTSGGNPKQIMRGKQIIFYALIGLALITFVRGTIELIYAILGVR